MIIEKFKYECKIWHIGAKMDRNLALEFARITEAAAIACARWMGQADKIKADKAAVDAMRKRFNYVDFNGKVVIGEGEKR